MLKKILEQIQEKPFLTEIEQKRLIVQGKEAGMNIAEIGTLLGFEEATFWRRRKTNQVPRICSVVFELADKAQKYEEIKKIWLKLFFY